MSDMNIDRPRDDGFTMGHSPALSGIAETIKQSMNDPNFVAPRTEPEPPEEGYQGPGAVVIGNPPPPKASSPVASVKPKGPAPVPVGMDNIDLSAGNLVGPNSPNQINSQFIIEGVTEPALRQIMPDVPEEEFLAYAKIARTKFEEYRRQMIIQGLNPQEALEATKANLMRDAKAMNEAARTAEKPGDTVDVVINKEQEGSVIKQFTPEEKEKMAKAKMIRLVVVEDESLKNITIEKVDIKHRADYIHAINGNLSKYSVPMPATGDYFTFRGGQLVQLAALVANDDENPYESTARKAQFLYDKFVGGTVIQKGEHSTYSSMSYEDFTNAVAYNDIDMGLYAILCAGQMEFAETDMTCNRCKNEWKHKYNTKTLLSSDGFPEHFKARTDNILANCNNSTILGEYNAAMHKAVRYKSPFTQNIYDLEIPSIAKALRVFNIVDPKDPIKSYHSAMILYIHTAYIYNPEKGTYSQIDSSDEYLPTLFDTVALIPDEDMNMISKEIAEKYIYSPSFKMPVVCPKCGNKSDLDLDIKNMVFLKAQDTVTETM